MPLWLLETLTLVNLLCKPPLLGVFRRGAVRFLRQRLVDIPFSMEAKCAWTLLHHHFFLENHMLIVVIKSIFFCGNHYVTSQLHFSDAFPLVGWSAVATCVKRAVFAMVILKTSQHTWAWDHTFFQQWNRTSALQTLCVLPSLAPLSKAGFL